MAASDPPEHELWRSCANVLPSRASWLRRSTRRRDEPMGDKDWLADDDQLVSELRDAVGGAEEPSLQQITEWGRGCFSWRTIDSELQVLSLAFDSALSQTSFRDTGDSIRLLVFENDDATVELEIGNEVLMGQVVPAWPGTVMLEAAGGELWETGLDDAGFFLLRRPRHGPIRLKVRA